MNMNQLKGAFKDAAGKAQRKAGEAAGSGKLQRKGLATQVQGKAQKIVGDVQAIAAQVKRRI